MVNNQKKKRDELDVTNYKTEISDRVAILYSKRFLTKEQLYNNSPKVFDEVLGKAKTTAEDALSIAKRIQSMEFKPYYVDLEKEDNVVDEETLNPVFGRVYAVWNKLYEGRLFRQSLDDVFNRGFKFHRTMDYEVKLVSILPKNVIIVPNDKLTSTRINLYDLKKDVLEVKSSDGSSLSPWNFEGITISIKYSNAGNVLLYLTQDASNLPAEPKHSRQFVNLTDIFREKYEKKSE